MPYYDRKSDDVGRVLCDACGADAWPAWPLTIERPASGPLPTRTIVLTGERAAFERRYVDPSGDWCWTPFYGTAPYVPGETYPCAGCDGTVDNGAGLTIVSPATARAGAPA